MVSGSSSRSDDRSSNPAPTAGGTLERPSPVGSSHGYQRFMRCRYSSASGGYGLLAPSDRAVICSAKPLRSYLLADFIKRYINRLILYYIIYFSTLNCTIQGRDVYIFRYITNSQIVENENGSVT